MVRCSHIAEIFCMQPYSGDYSGLRLSWRVANTPKSSYSYSNSGSPTKRSNLNKTNSPYKPSSSSPIYTPSHSLSHSYSSVQSRLWNTWGRLFANVNAAVDELYALCEEEADEVKCREALDMFERCRLDFDQLIVRIEQQAR